MAHISGEVKGKSGVLFQTSHCEGDKEGIRVSRTFTLALLEILE
jgi:hypothetical protein